jgi:hypothetical protein
LHTDSAFLKVLRLIPARRGDTTALRPLGRSCQGLLLECSGKFKTGTSDCPPSPRLRRDRERPVNRQTRMSALQ